MHRTLWLAVALALLLPGTARIAAAGAVFLGPGPGLTGNDIGGIIQYTPDVMVHGLYRDIAADWCARWGRLSYVTSVHARYGEYISFVCMDRPGMIH